MDKQRLDFGGNTTTVCVFKQRLQMAAHLRALLFRVYVTISGNANDKVLQRNVSNVVGYIVDSTPFHGYGSDFYLAVDQ